MSCRRPAPIETVKFKVPAEARRAAGATAVSWVPLTKVVVSAVLPSITTVDERKFVPVKVKVVSCERA